MSMGELSYQPPTWFVVAVKVTITTWLLLCQALFFEPAVTRAAPGNRVAAISLITPYFALFERFSSRA